jgi:MATE family multidrug resistance protein
MLGLEIVDFKKTSERALKLALPIVFGQLGLVFMGFFDILMLGKVGTHEIAAVGIANALFFLFFLFGLGVTFAISPLVAISCGSGQSWKSWLILKSSFKVSLILGIGLFIIYSLLGYIFPYLNQEPEVETLALDYLNIVSWSVLPMLLFTSAKHYLDGHSRTVPPSVITISALIANIILNQILIFGTELNPAYGIKGAAYATLIVRFLMLGTIVIFLYFDKATIRYRLLSKSRVFTGNIERKIWITGIPIGFQFFFEVASFSFAAVMAGWLGSVSQAAHNIALNLASVTFMGATGISAAGSVLIGNSFGARIKSKILNTGKVIIFLVFAYMLFCALAFLIFRLQLAEMFSKDSEVIGVTTGLLILASLFQISDGLQSAGMGLLRGLKDVKAPSLIAFISYWVIGMPFSYLTGFVLGWGISGVWVGFIVGLSIAAFLLVKRFFGILKKINFDISND